MKNSRGTSLTKIAAVGLSFILAFGTGGMAYAAEPEFDNTDISVGTDERNVGVSPVCPEAATRSTSRPSKTWEVNKSGRYDFSGYSTSQTLYTNWQFKGKRSYTIKVNNTGSGTITVKAKTVFTTYAQTRVGAGQSATLSLSGMDTGTSFYITFDGSNYSFNGYIS